MNENSFFTIRNVGFVLIAFIVFALAFGLGFVITKQMVGNNKQPAEIFIPIQNIEALSRIEAKVDQLLAAGKCDCMPSADSAKLIAIDEKLKTINAILSRPLKVNTDAKKN